MYGTIAEFLILLVAHAAAGIYSTSLKYDKKKVIIIWAIWIVLQGSLLFYSNFWITDKSLQFFAGFIMSLVGQYVIFFLTTKGRLVQRIFTILTYSIFFCMVMTIFTVIKSSFGEIHPLPSALIQATMLFGVVSYYIFYVCALCRSAAKNITSGWIPLIVVNVVFLIILILSSVFPIRLTRFSDPTFISFVFICIVIMAVYPVVFSSINSMSDAAMKREVESQNQLLLAQIKTENAQLAADSQSRHDRRHHNLVMLEFANNNDIESVRAYLKSLVDSDSEVWGDSRHCENMTVNTVLTVYERRAEACGISVKIAASVSRELDVPPQDLVIVIANLFENAINATSRLKMDGKQIDIYIKEKANRLLIRVENPCKNNMKFDESCHGIGIRSVIATTEKYDGMYDFAADDGVFSAKINLNLK